MFDFEDHMTLLNFSLKTYTPQKRKANMQLKTYVLRKNHLNLWIFFVETQIWQVFDLYFNNNT